MARTRLKEQPVLMLRKTMHGLAPLDAIDAERLAAIPFGHDVEVTIKARRSLPQLRLYWKILAEVVAATDCAPSAKQLDRSLKYDMGYVETFRTFRGDLVEMPDSIAFENMEPHEFKVFFDRAMKTIAERLQIDPLAEYEQRKAA